MAILIQISYIVALESIEEQRAAYQLCTSPWDLPPLKLPETKKTRRPEQTAKLGDLGLPPNQVWLCTYSLQWPAFFAQEAILIGNALSSWVLDIQHVGSTSIIGLKAKPIIDILLGVERFQVGLHLVRPFEALGYRYLSKQVVAGHHVFARGTAITHLVHVVEYLSPQWKRVITFRDILRIRPDLAARYEAEKIRLSLAFATNRTAYSSAKEPLIDAILHETAANAPPYGK